MKSTRIIFILFLLYSVTNFAKFNPEIISDYFNKNRLTDRLSFTQNQRYLNENNAYAIIETYQRALDEGMVLTEEDLKKVTLSYAAMNNASKASEYLNQYIKKSNNIEILENTALSRIKNSKEYLSVSKKYKPQFNFWFVIYFYIGMIGVFIAIILNFRSESDRRANFFISLFILFSSLFVIHISIFISNVQFYFPHSLYATITFSFLYGPLLYFYFKCITEKYRIKSIDSLHFIPSLLLLFYFIKYYSLSADEKLDILINREENFDPILIYVVILKIISLIVYGILVYKMYIKARSKKLKEHEIILKWQKNIVFLNSVYVFSHIFYVLMITGLLPMNFLIHPQIISMSLLILYVGYSAYVQPKVFNKKYYNNDILYFKYQNSGISKSYSHELKEHLVRLLVEKKIYKENNITLDILSQRLSTTRHSTSQVINEHFDMNFFKLINRFRIEEAIEILKSNHHKNLNIIDIAYEVGFNNKVTFNKAFKEEIKLTPTQYLHKLNETGLATSG